jgi:hypothetical protein
VMEHQLYPLCVAEIVSGRIRLVDNRTHRDGAPGALSLLWAVAAF